MESKSKNYEYVRSYIENVSFTKVYDTRNYDIKVGVMLAEEVSSDKNYMVIGDCALRSQETKEIILEMTVHTHFKSLEKIDNLDMKDKVVKEIVNICINEIAFNISYITSKAYDVPLVINVEETLKMVDPNEDW